jgi:carbon-monoxide dehydrogenase small subunit
MSTTHISVTVNGEAREADVEPRLLLVHLLRENFGLTGTHIGCDTSNCGACTVHVNGESAKSCTMLAVQADGAQVTTIEGMADGADAPPVAAGVLGPARPPVRLLHAGHDHAGRLAPEAEPGADEEEIRAGISGNLCRCTGYVNIVKAIKQAAGELSAA